MKRLSSILPTLLLMLTLASCNMGKYVSQDQKILRNNKVSITMSDSTSTSSEIQAVLSDVSQYYGQKPNKKFLFLPLYRWLYCIPEPTDSSLWGRFWHNMGSAPVIYNKGIALQTAAQITTLLKTKGSFNSTVSIDTLHVRKHMVDVTYNIKAQKRRVIDEVLFSCRQPDINQLLQDWKQESLIKVGDFYDQNLMTQEQQRIVNRLKNSGYYYANNDMIHFLVDTTYDPHRIGIMLVVRPTAPGSQNNNFLHPYSIDRIFIYPNISTALGTRNNNFDTLIYQYKHKRGISDYYFVHDKPISPSPRTIARSLFIFQGMPYRPNLVTNTSNSLLGLRNFKYVDISFEESPHSNDTLKLLDARIRLLNSNRHRVSLSFELTNASDLGTTSGSGNFITSGNLGIGTSVGYENNNLFGGAERFNVTGSLVFDFPKKVFSSQATSFYDIFANFESDITASLDLPSFAAPFAGGIVWQSSKPHTILQLSHNYMLRGISVPIDFQSGQSGTTDIRLERVRLGGSFGYTWNHGQNVQHTLLPVNLSYSQIISGDQYYFYLASLTHDIQFLYQTVDHVLLNTHYEYTFTNQDPFKRNNFRYFHFSVETAGNLLNGVANIVSERSQQPLDTRKLEFAQYVRFESEFKQYFYHGQKSTFVMRSLAGFALPYGQSVSVPYEKMFTGGGPTSMRGWALRHLGPGYSNILLKDYSYGVGAIQLIFNLEERFPIFGIFEGAVFADIGNVWDWSDWGVDTYSRVQPDNTAGDIRFVPKNIFKSFALDAGIGIRAKISVITLRLDLAMPLYDPIFDEGERWFTRHWSNDILALNFGINYPF